MTPPRVLPPGHFVGDGHNHGRASGEQLHNHGHDHAQESPEQHLRHMQQQQRARGRATLEEFQRAAQETRTLTSGQQPENARPDQRAAQARQAPKENAAGLRQGQGTESRQPAQPETARRPAENARSGGRETAAWVRLFSSPNRAAPEKATSAWADASRRQTAASRQGESSAAGRRPGAEAGLPGRLSSEAASLRSGREPGSADLKSSASGNQAAPILHALAKLQGALQAAARSGATPAKLPAEAAEAVGLLLRKAMASPEFLASLPPSLKALVQNMMGPAGALLPQIFPKMAAAGLVPALQVWLGRSPPGNFSGAERVGAQPPLRGLGLLLGAPFFATGSASKLPANLLQRLEKALLQFFQLLTAKPNGTPLKPTAVMDKALLEQLAALVAAEEKRRKERERAKKEEEISPELRAKRDSEFSEGEEEPEFWEEYGWLSHG